MPSSLQNRLNEVSKEELFHQIYHDGITDYYNWSYLWKHLDKRFRKNDFIYCFVHFNIKDMKMVNVIYGHDAANELLTFICKKIEEEREAGWVFHACRCDNDNFAMMIKVMPEEEIIEKLTNFFNKVSFLPCDSTYQIYYRCGVVTSDDALASDDRVADYAKFAQNLGQNYLKNDINFFTQEMYSKMLDGKKLISRLDRAIASDEFLIYFQPKYDIISEKIVGAEALVRWYYNQKNMISPGVFIPVFEENGVIGKLDQVVLRKVCQTLATILEKGLQPVPISINLSRIRLKNPNLKNELTKIIDLYQIPHNLIDFELTESAAYNNDEAMISLFNDLHSLGFKVSLDDFGTGYSSLSVLRKIPMDTLKIDKSFIDVINSNISESKENLLLKDIIAMSKHLGFICLAEGAEDKNQIEFLRSAGCDSVQGFFYCKPIPENEFIKKLQTAI